jgi:hypothetical protein
MKRPALFDAFWTDTTTGRRSGRATRAELAEANRLWWKHRDLRERGGKKFARVILIDDEPDDIVGVCVELIDGRAA